MFFDLHRLYNSGSHDELSNKKKDFSHSNDVLWSDYFYTDHSDLYGFSYKYYLAFVVTLRMFNSLIYVLFEIWSIYLCYHSIILIMQISRYLYIYT